MFTHDNYFMVKQLHSYWSLTSGDKSMTIIFILFTLQYIKRCSFLSLYLWKLSDFMWVQSTGDAVYYAWNLELLPKNILMHPKYDFFLNYPQFFQCWNSNIELLFVTYKYNVITLYPNVDYYPIPVTNLDIILHTFLSRNI